MIPTLARPGDVAPGQFGPMRRAPWARTTSTAGIMSSAGMPSVMQKIVAMPAAAASITASGAPAAGTKMQEVFAPVCGHGLGDRVEDRDRAVQRASGRPCPASRPTTTLVP